MVSIVATVTRDVVGAPFLHRAQDSIASEQGPFSSSVHPSGMSILLLRQAGPVPLVMVCSLVCRVNRD